MSGVCHVPTRSDSQYDSMLLARLLEIRKNLRHSAACHFVVFGNNLLDIATNQEAAGSSPAGRANLYRIVRETAG